MNRPNYYKKSLMSIYLLLTLAMLTATPISAQDLAPDKIPTPTAASLGRYGDLPVSYYTGNPGISIPLYTMVSRGLELPVSLDYESSGVQMNVLPSWTGYNWTLNAGGVITRSINGRPDEYIFPEQAINTVVGTPKNYFSCHSKLSEFLRYGWNDSIRSSLTYAKYDFEPDIFTFHFMGKSGKFFLDNNGRWRVQCDEDIEVLFDVTDYESQLLSPFIDKYPYQYAADRNQPKTIAGFKLRDSKGYVYEFGGFTDAIEYTTPFLEAGDREDIASWLATSWYLTSVRDRLGNVLFTLEYNRGHFMTQIYNTAMFVSYKEHDQASIWNYGESGGYCNYGINQFPYEMQLDAPVYLNKIHSSNGVTMSFQVQSSPVIMSELYESFCAQTGLNQRVAKSSSSGPFYYLQNSQFSQYHATTGTLDYGDTQEILDRTGLMVLGSIRIASPYDNSTYKTFGLHYDYTGRMHLTSVTEMTGPVGGDRKIYRMVYDNYDMLPTDCLTQACDHWGYYNGHSYTLPMNYQQADTFHLQRNANPTTLQYGALKKIIYPTGGASMMEYEQNSYSFVEFPAHRPPVPQTSPWGGMRIKSITEYEDSACTMLLKRKSFSYTDPATGLSSGSVFAKPTYLWKEWQALNENGGNTTKYVTTFRTTSIIPLSNSFGPSVGYSHVEERFSNGCKNVYSYSSREQAMDSLIVTPAFNTSARSPYDKLCSREYRRGRLLSSCSLDSAGNKVKETVLHYRTDNVEQNYALASNLRFEAGSNSSVFAYFPGRVYNLYWPKYDVVSKTERNWMDNGNQTIDSVSYRKSDINIHVFTPYDHFVNFRCMNSETTIRGNQSMTKEYVYPLDAEHDASPLLNQDHLLQPIATKTYSYNILVKTDTTVYNQQTVNGKNLLMPKYEMVKRGVSTDTLTHFYMYSPEGNLKSYISKGIYTMLVWKLNGNYLACKITDHFPTFMDHSFNDLVVFNPSLMHELAQELVVNRYNYSKTMMLTFYTYSPLKGITSITDPNGATTYYHYDSLWQLDRITDDAQRVLKSFQYNYRIKP